MNVQTAMEKSNHVERTKKGSVVATRYIDYFARGKIFPFFDRFSPEKKRMVKIIHIAEGQAGEFNVYLKNVV